jgi:hypothetical protein
MNEGPDAGSSGKPDTSVKDARADRGAPDTGTKHDAGSDAGDAGNDANGLFPGEICAGGPPNIRFDPPIIVVTAGKFRPARVIVEPDVCSPSPITFSSSNAALVPAPAGSTLNLRTPIYDFNVYGGPPDAGSTATGMATITASMPSGTDGGAPSTATLPVYVNNGSLPTCAATDVAMGQLSGSATTLAGAGGLATAALSVPPGAFARTDEFAIQPFPGTIACANDDLTVAKAAGSGTKAHAAAAGALVPIGPAVTFTAGSPIDMTASLRRELDFSIPVNPAAVPTYARLRHLQVLYMSPGSEGITTNPVALTIADPMITQTPSGSFVLSFSSPWFGTYQAAYSPDAGTVTRTRHVTHRAVFGVSMGAGGAATFGFRHHDQFDFVGPLGGPSDNTWLLWYISTYNLGGFCPQILTDGTPNPAYPHCPTYAPNLYPIQETFAHTCDYDHWFYQAGGGNGGGFSRASYAQIFADLALMRGNPNSQSFDPSVPDASRQFDYLPAGMKGTDPWVTGRVDAGLPGSCAIVTNPLNPDPNDADPPVAVQQQWSNLCSAARCSQSWVIPSGYFDGEYNPAGTYPVIASCESGVQVPDASPYENVWSPPQPGNSYPLETALVVDLNGNGVRDENEPIIRQGTEPWSDVGVDGLADVDEPGYDPMLNPDPNQDDYDFQRNPNGTEGNHRYDTGEPFKDYGLDAVQGTPQLKNGGYDYGEGDGVFTTTTGLARYYADDPHSILHQWSTPPGGMLDDTALLRINVWTDGGVRDLFNFESVANHLIGAIASRKVTSGPDTGTQLRSTAFFNGFDKLPGQVVGDEDAFDINAMRWADLPDAPHIRYGTIDATPAMLAAGDGQHVGTGEQILDRFQTAVYAATQLWPDADRTLTSTTSTGDAGIPDAGLANNCSGGNCEFPFAADNRVGPVFVQLPPGYNLPENVARNVRYPVIFALHGYGQTPDGLAAVALVSTDLMNDGARSEATRLAKALIVYVDGRCRFSSDSPAQPECIEGSFYFNSDRPDIAHPGTNVAQFDAWFDDLVAYIDSNFRTMPAADIEVTE